MALRFIKPAFVVEVLFLVISCTLQANASDPVVKLKNGVSITGKQLQFRAKGTDFNVDTYLGIPYAEPPVGPLRFKQTVPKELTEDFNAQEYGNVCPQPILPGLTAFFKYTQEDVDEDCLVLSVYVPTPKPTNAAVMFHIHGGGYMTGVGTWHGFDLHPMTGLGDVITVTINYRLGALGFLSTADDVIPGNMGMFDQLEALKWVNKNIEAFGGNPNQVTIFGISAGGSSSSLHTLSPLSKGLFFRAIMQSGNAAGIWSHSNDTENIRKRAFYVGKLVGCENETTKQLAECLMDKSPDDLVQAYQTSLADPNAGIFFSPVFDGKFFTEMPMELIKKRSFPMENVDVIVGHTLDEGVMFIATMLQSLPEKPHYNITFFDLYTSLFTYPPNDIKPNSLQRKAMELVYFDDYILNDPDPNYFDVLVEIVSDTFCHCPTDEYIRAAAEANLGSVYAYEFTFHPSISLFNTPWSGACHGDDALFLGFGFNSDSNVTLTDQELELTLKVISYWTNFAKTGNPNYASESDKASSPAAKLLEWPRFTLDNRMYKELSPEMKNIPDPSGMPCRFWNDYLPKLNAALDDKECTSHWTKGDQETCADDSCSDESKP